MTDLKRKRALVTGGSRSIGAAIAQVLAKNGADAAITFQRAGDRAAPRARTLEGLGRRAIAIQGDSADPAAIVRSLSDTVAALGLPDILIPDATSGAAMFDPHEAQRAPASRP